MNKHRILSTLTAVLCTAATLTALPIHAGTAIEHQAIWNEATDRYFAGNDGLCYVGHGKGASPAGLMIVTDGTAPSVDDLPAVVQLVPWNTYLENAGEYVAGVDMFQGFHGEMTVTEPEQTYYLELADTTLLSSVGKTIAQTQPCVQQVCLVEKQEYQETQWGGEFQVYTSTEVEELAWSDFPELAAFGTGKAFYFDFEDQDGIRRWHFQLQEASALQQERAGSVEEYLAVKAAEESLSETNSAVLEVGSSFPFVAVEKAYPHTFALSSVWENAGDVTGNAATDAKDASRMMQYIADEKAGVMPASEMTAVLTAADVDGDGSLTAKDVQGVLRYAAKRSAGMPAEWTEILAE